MTIRTSEEDYIDEYIDNFTHEGIANKIANMSTGSLKYVTGIGWYHWTGTQWERDPEKSVARRTVAKALKKLRVQAVIENDKRKEKFIGSLMRSGTYNALLRICADLPNMRLTPEQEEEVREATLELRLNKRTLNIWVLENVLNKG